MGTITFNTNYSNEPTAGKGATSGSTLRFVSPADQAQRVANLQTMVNADLKAEIARLELYFKAEVERLECRQNSAQRRVLQLQRLLGALVLSALSAVLLKVFF